MQLFQGKPGAVRIFDHGIRIARDIHKIGKSRSRIRGRAVQVFPFYRYHLKPVARVRIPAVGDRKISAVNVPVYHVEITLEFETLSGSLL